MSSLSIIRTKLAAHAGVVAITTPVGIYPYQIPQNGHIPAIVMNRSGGVDHQTLSGAGKYFRNRIALDCLATTPDEAEALGDEAMDALGDVVKETVGVHRDVDIMFADFDETSPADVQQLNRRILHFWVHYRKG